MVGNTGSWNEQLCEEYIEMARGNTSIAADSMPALVSDVIPDGIPNLSLTS